MNLQNVRQKIKDKKSRNKLKKIKPDKSSDILTKKKKHRNTSFLQTEYKFDLELGTRTKIQKICVLCSKSARTILT